MGAAPTVMTAPVCEASLMSQYHPAPGPGEEAAETNGLAIASLFLGIIWLFGIGSILAIVLGYVGMREVRASNGRQSGWAIALAGLIVGIIGLASLGVLIAFILSSAHHTPQLPGPTP